MSEENSTNERREVATIATRLLAARVDYLQIAFRVALSEETLTTLRHRSAAARANGGNIAELVVGRLIGELRVPRDGVDRYPFRNGDVRGIIGTKEPGGWSVEFHVRAAFLATHTIEQAVKMCEEIAASLGQVDGRRLRRLDLAADFSGFPLGPTDIDALVIPRRGRKGAFHPASKDLDDANFLPERREYRVAGRISGFAVCPGNDASARIYDKTQELQLSGREEKREIEESRWRLSGWVENDQVTRVEFQLRGVALDELDLRDPSAKRLQERIDPVWQYLVKEWLRLIDHDNERKSRCSAAARWLAVQGVTFVHASMPSKRTRRRGGATPEQAVGALLSALHGARWLPRVNYNALEVSEMTRDDQDAYTRSLMVDLGMTMAMRLAEYFQGKHGLEGAPLAIATRWNATWARFWSHDDLEMPGRWTARPRPAIDAGEDWASKPRDPSNEWSLSYVESAGSAALADILDDERRALQSAPNG